MSLRNSEVSVAVPQMNLDKNSLGNRSSSSYTSSADVTPTSCFQADLMPSRILGRTSVHHQATDRRSRLSVESFHRLVYLWVVGADPDVVAT